MYLGVPRYHYFRNRKISKMVSFAGKGVPYWACGLRSVRRRWDADASADLCGALVFRPLRLCALLLFLGSSAPSDVLPCWT